MTSENLWEKSREICIKTSADIVGNFDIGFDDNIPDETKDALMKFVYWVEDHYNLPVTLWVDFKYKHYLIDCNKKRVGYKFYWVDFANYPVFENADDIPVIELSGQNRALDDGRNPIILYRSHYALLAWLANIHSDGFTPNEDLVELILRSYLKTSDANK